MLNFWLAASFLLLIALLVTGFALSGAYKRQRRSLDYHTAICQQRMAEIDADVTNDLISKIKGEELKKQFQSELLQQDNRYPKLQIASIKSVKLAAVILIVFIPTFTISLYYFLGQPDYIKQLDLLSEFNQAKTEKARLTSAEKLLKQLEKRMLNEPDNFAGWLILADTYTVLKRYPEAMRAIDKLYRPGKEDPVILLRHADILAKANNNVFTGKPTELINQAIQLAPENPDALWLAGLAANKRGDTGSAVRYWQQLLPKLKQGSHLQQQLKSYINLARPAPRTSVNSDDKAVSGTSL